MRFGLSLSISGVVLLGFSWAAKLRGEERMCVFVFCVQICLCVCEPGGDWTHYACSSLQSDLLVLIGKDSSNKHRGVVVTQAWHECREAGSAGCSSRLQPSLFPNPALPASPPPWAPPPGCPWPPAWPRRVATEWALCLDTAISSQRTSEMWAGQGSGQRRRQKHGCLRHLGSQQLTEGPTQRRGCWSMGSVICIEYRPPSLSLCTSRRARTRANMCVHPLTLITHIQIPDMLLNKRHTHTLNHTRLHTDVNMLHQCLH